MLWARGDSAHAWKCEREEALGDQAGKKGRTAWVTGIQTKHQAPDSAPNVHTLCRLPRGVLYIEWGNRKITDRGETVPDRYNARGEKPERLPLVARNRSTAAPALWEGGALLATRTAGPEGPQGKWPACMIPSGATRQHPPC